MCAPSVVASNTANANPADVQSLVNELGTTMNPYRSRIVTVTGTGITEAASAGGALGTVISVSPFRE